MSASAPTFGHSTSSLPSPGRCPKWFRSRFITTQKPRYVVCDDLLPFSMRLKSKIVSISAQRSLGGHKSSPVPDIKLNNGLIKVPFAGWSGRLEI
ncbi:hypothetical protein SCLCIDRAFT_971538 [Scleroderma citrinum Foug A]|uniref:Uncharacterized protein n=1 Tax=Scleroderma citrinum Foug A TaxID=1036808 RepID=A0A0C3DHI2_9AGAM|nr:hypothetical protein SCLCIDRAFT_971538 [Scleroderma citrinum Foug A]